MVLLTSLKLASYKIVSLNEDEHNSKAFSASPQYLPK